MKGSCGTYNIYKFRKYFLTRLTNKYIKQMLILYSVNSGNTDKKFYSKWRYYIFFVLFNVVVFSWTKFTTILSYFYQINTLPANIYTPNRNIYTLTRNIHVLCGDKPKNRLHLAFCLLFIYIFKIILWVFCF